MAETNGVVFVGLNELADWLKLTQRRVIQLVDEGVIPKEAKGKYPLKECVSEYLAYLRALADGVGKKSELSQEKLLTARIERRRRELEFAQQEGNLISIDDHKAAMEKALDLVRSNIRNLPGALAPRLVAIDDPRDVQHILVREVDDALRSIVDKAQRRTEDAAALPDDLPGRARLIKAGITNLVDLLDVESLTGLPGIGQATARKIRAWMSERP